MNYDLRVNLIKENEQVSLGDATVNLGSFNNVFPDKKEMMQFSFPKLTNGASTMEWKVTSDRVTQTFDPYVKQKHK